MKTVGKRMAHLRKNVLNITVERMKEITGVSRTPIAQLENEQDAPRALEQIIQSLHLNPEWVHKNKLPIFVSGTDEENVARIKQGNKSTATTSDPWKDEAYVQIKQERDRLLDDVSKYKAWMNRIMNGEINFLAPLGNKASYGKLRIAKP